MTDNFLFLTIHRLCEMGRRSVHEIVITREAGERLKRVLQSDALEKSQQGIFQVRHDGFVLYSKWDAQIVIRWQRDDPGIPASIPHGPI